MCFIYGNASKAITKLVILSANGVLPEVRLWYKNNFWECKDN